MCFVASSPKTSGETSSVEWCWDERLCICSMRFYDWVVQKPWGLLVGSMGSLFQVLCKAERAILVCWVVSFSCIYCQKSIAISSSFIRFYIAKCYVPNDIYDVFFHPFRFHYDFTSISALFISSFRFSSRNSQRILSQGKGDAEWGSFSPTYVAWWQKGDTLEVKDAMVSEAIIPYINISYYIIWYNMI